MDIFLGANMWGHNLGFIGGLSSAFIFYGFHPSTAVLRIQPNKIIYPYFFYLFFCCCRSYYTWDIYCYGKLIEKSSTWVKFWISVFRMRTGSGSGTIGIARVMTFTFSKYESESGQTHGSGSAALPFRTLIKATFTSAFTWQNSLQASLYIYIYIQRYMNKFQRFLIHNIMNVV